MSEGSELPADATETDAPEDEASKGGNLDFRKKTRRDYTTEEWLKIRTYYESGDYTIQQICDMFGRTHRSVKNRLNRYKVVKGSKKRETEERALKEMEKDMAKNVGLRVRRANETKEEHYEWAKKLSQLTVQKVADALKSGKPLGDIKPDLLALKTAMETLEKGQSMRNVSLGLDKGDVLDEDQLPEFNVLEMSEEERTDIILKADSLLKITEEEAEIESSMPTSVNQQSDSEAELRSNMERLRSEVEDEDEGDKPPTRIPGHDGY